MANVLVRKTRKANNNLQLRNFLLTLNPEGLDVELWEDWKRDQYGIRVSQGGHDLLFITCLRPKHDKDDSDDVKIRDCVESYLNPEECERSQMLLPKPARHFTAPEPPLTWKLIPSKEEEDDFLFENQ